VLIHSREPAPHARQARSRSVADRADDTAVLGYGDVVRMGDSVFVYCTDEPMQRSRNNAQQSATDAPAW
jgi:hypothetical protein